MTTTKIKIAALLTAVLTVLSAVPIIASAAEVLPVEPTLSTDKYDLDDDGNADEVYEIGNAEELYWFAAEVNGGNTQINAVLTDNITVNKNVLKDEGGLNGDGSEYAVWTPVGNDDNRYSGIFDGQGHYISGLYCIEAETNHIGLFGYARDAEIRNTAVIDSYFYGKNNVGGLCGSANNCVITNCYSSSIAGGRYYIGGLIGSSVGSSVTSCYNDGVAAGYEYVGGLFGFLSVLFTEDKTLTVADCFNSGIVGGLGETDDTVGSIAGSRAANEENPLIIKNCYGIGDIALFGITNVEEQIPYITAENCESKTKVEFADGTVLGLLNGENGKAWIQNTENDSHPLLLDMHIHDYGKKWEDDESNYWLECFCGDIKYDVFVHNVWLTPENKNDVFGDGKVSFDPATRTLTLNGWQCIGEGYVYGGNDETSRVYSAVIFSEGDICINTVADSAITNTFAEGSTENEKRYGDVIVSRGDITIVGDGLLSVSGSFGISSRWVTKIDGAKLNITSQDGIISGGTVITGGAVVTIIADDEAIVADDEGANVTITGGSVVTIKTDGVGVVSDEDSVFIEDGATLKIDTTYDGIFAEIDIVITDSTVEITSEKYALYSCTGSVTVDSTSTALSDDGSTVEGTRVSVTGAEEYAIYAPSGITVDEMLTVLPSDIQIAERTDTEEDGTEFSYTTFVVGEELAKDFVIEPFGYSVKLAEFDVEVLVPAGKSFDDVKTAPTMPKVEREGYTFAGWYTDEDCSDGNEYDTSAPVDGDITLYAKWTENKGSVMTAVLWIAVPVIICAAVIVTVACIMKKKRNAK